MPLLGDVDANEGNRPLSACKIAPSDVGLVSGCKLSHVDGGIKGDNLEDFLSAVSRPDVDCKNAPFLRSCSSCTSSNSESSASAAKSIHVPPSTRPEPIKVNSVPAPSLFSFTAVDPNDPMNKLLRRYIHVSTSGVPSLATATAASAAASTSTSTTNANVNSTFNGCLENVLDSAENVNMEPTCALGVVVQYKDDNDNDNDNGTSQPNKVSIDDENASRYCTIFHESVECNNALRGIFGSINGSIGVDADCNCSFEWLPQEPPTAVTSLTNAEEIETLLSQDDGIVDGFDGNLICNDFSKCDYKVTLHGDVGQTDVDLKLQELSLVHESLNAGSEVASLSHLERFLLELLQPSITSSENVNVSTSSLGNLTRFGRLMAFVNLAFVQKHIAQLTALYRHPEMAAFRSALVDRDPVLASTFQQGQGAAPGNIWNTIQYSAGYEDPFPDGTNTQAIVKLLNKLAKSESAYGGDASVSYNAYANVSGNIDLDDGYDSSLLATSTSTRAYPCSVGSCSSSFFKGGGGKNGGAYATSTGTSTSTSTSAKLQRQLVEVLDCISCAYTTGREPHFPRFVCGVIDRTLVNATETFSVPLKKSDRRNVHIQLERLSNNQREWPVLNALPPVLSEGMQVQIAPQKMHAYMYWREGTITSISAGVITVAAATEQDRERTFSLKNFMAPNCPVLKLERGYWRLMPRRLCLETDLYVGSCLCIDDGNGDYVDGVIVNLYFERNCIAPVKSPGDESLFEHVNSCGASLEPNVTCTCTGHCLRVFEACTLSRQPLEIVLHHFHENRQRIYSVENLEGYKLNYDLQAHYDLAKQGNSTHANLSFCVWVIPRDLSNLKGINLSSGWNSIATRSNSSDTIANGTNGTAAPSVDVLVKKWMYDVRRMIILFPYNRNIDIFQDANCQILSFLHPEMNFGALAAGVWSVRTNDKLINMDAAYAYSLVAASTGVGEGNSCTRSQKAAIRDSTNDATDQTTGVLQCRFSLLRRLYGCHAIISIWIAMEAIDPGAYKFKPDLNVQVPALPSCTKCKGSVYSRREITRRVPHHEGNSHHVYIFSNLERTSDLVRRIQHVAACRWRVTRDFLASYRVDDDVASYFRLGPGINTSISSSGNEQGYGYSLESGTSLTLDATRVAAQAGDDAKAKATNDDDDDDAADDVNRPRQENDDSQRAASGGDCNAQAHQQQESGFGVNFALDFANGTSVANDIAVAAAAQVGGVEVCYIPDGHNYSFLRHLYHVMASVRATIDSAPLDDFYYRNAYLDVRYDLASATEVAMEQGWEAYIRPMHARQEANVLQGGTKTSTSNDVAKLLKSPQEFKPATLPSIPGMEAFSDFSQLMRLKGQDLTRALAKDLDTMVPTTLPDSASNVDACKRVPLATVANGDVTVPAATSACVSGNTTGVSKGTMACATDLEQLAAFNRVYSSKTRDLSLEMPAQYMQMLNSSVAAATANDNFATSDASAIKSKRVKVASKRFMQQDIQGVPRKVRHVKESQVQVQEKANDYSQFTLGENPREYPSSVEANEHLKAKEANASLAKSRD